jgi:hypothetical protein
VLGQHVGIEHRGALCMFKSVNLVNWQLIHTTVMSLYYFYWSELISNLIVNISTFEYY